MRVAPTIFLVACLLTPCLRVAGVVQGADQTWHFTPVTLDWQNDVAELLGVTVKWNMEKYWDSRGSLLTSPKKVEKIRGDGNCFFRAISYVVTGVEDNHEQIRKTVVNFMRYHMAGEATEEHLQDMAKGKTWATDAEITAAARLLKTPVFVYTPYGNGCSWAQYTPNEDYTLVMDDNIPRVYLKMVDRSHFEVVSAVE